MAKTIRNNKDIYNNSDLETKIEDVSNVNEEIDQEQKAEEIKDKYVFYKDNKYKILEEFNGNVLIEIEIINNSGVKEKIKQWYKNDAVKFI